MSQVSIISARELDALDRLGILFSQISDSGTVTLPKTGSLVGYQVIHVRVYDEFGFTGIQKQVRFIGFLNGEKVIERQAKIKNAEWKFVIFGELRRHRALRKVVRVLKK